LQHIFLKNLCFTFALAMEKNWKERTELIIGLDGSTILQNSHVLIVGLGGVGSYAAEAIARAGVGKLTIVDGDVVDPTIVTDNYKHYQAHMDRVKLP
jgi:tRNA A37 threonylcarbamoyladenosine dehydratase